MALLSNDLPENSVNVDVPVNNAKCFVEKPEYRIKLDELFSRETCSLLDALNVAASPLQAGSDQQDFRARIKFYEDVTEPLAKMAGVLGRWGDGSELPLVLDVIRMLYAQVKTATSRSSSRTEIRSYPAVLIFTAYGIGLTRAQRWGSFHELCSAEIARENQEPARLIERLFLWDWEGSEESLWKQLEGVESHRASLSQHLSDLFSNWGKSFTGLTPDHEILYGRFEIMGSLAYLSSTSESDLGSALNNKNRSDSSGFVRMPIGQTTLNQPIGIKLVKEFESSQTRKALVKAGFVSSEYYIDLFMNNFERVMGKIRWP
jgi:hypothetical protein